MLPRSTTKMKKRDAQPMNPARMYAYILGIVVIQKDIVDRSFNQTNDRTKFEIIFGIATMHFNH